MNLKIYKNIVGYINLKQSKKINSNCNVKPFRDIILLLAKLQRFQINNHINKKISPLLVLQFLYQFTLRYKLEG